jgi:transcription elongation factor Elf1
VVAVFLVSVADIIWWDSVLKYGVYAAIAVLFIVAIVLLFSRALSGTWKVGEVVLSCPSCENAFLYAADHADNKGHASMTCPICAHVADLPVSRDQSREMAIPTGQRYDHAYHCLACEEHIVVTTLGSDSGDLQFDACPHCGEHETVRKTSLPGEVERKRLEFWNSV